MYEFRIPFQNHVSRVTLTDAASPLAGRCEKAVNAGGEAGVGTLHVPGGSGSDRLMGTAAANELDREMIEAAWSAINEELQELEQRRQESLAEMQQAAVELAIAVASRLIHQSLQAGDFAIEEIVRDMVARCDQRGPATVYLHPADLELLQRRTGGNQTPAVESPASKIVADAALARGDCRVEAGDFGILANLELQLSELRQHLLEHLDDAQTERRQTQTGSRELRRFPDRRESA